MSRCGFTLLEMAIAIAVIGLVVAGILAGKDLIHASEIRATAAQFQEYNTAIQAFRLKFDCLPGDCKEVIALGFDAASAGNGDGIIGECTEAGTGCWSAGATNPVAEYYQAWYQLSATNLITDRFPLWTGTPSGQYATVGEGTPNAKINVVNRVHAADVYGPGGWWVQGDVKFAALGDAGFSSLSTSVGSPMHAFILAQRVPIGTSAGTYVFGNQGGYFPHDTYAIDMKLDDGDPISGFVRAWTTFYTSNSATASKGYVLSSLGTVPGDFFCAYQDTTGVYYNMQYPAIAGGGIVGACSLVFMAGF